MSAYDNRMNTRADIPAPLIVVITGAAGRIAYSLIPLVCDGSVFGRDRRISLRLIDIEMSMTKLQGVMMEIQDCNYDLLDSVLITSNGTGFKDAEVAILLGGYPRLPGMERKDLIEKNAEGMREQGLSLDRYASKNVKVLVVANPANTNMLVLLKTAHSIPKGNFTCLTRLDEERLRFVVADKINNDLTNLESDGIEYSGQRKIVRAEDVKDVFIFGNHSTTQVPYIDAGTVVIKGEIRKVSSFFTKDETNSLIHSIQNRGGEIIRKQNLSSGLSAAGAIARHLRDLFSDDALHPLSYIGENDLSRRTFSAGVSSDGNPYGIPEGMVFSFPCCLRDGEISIIPHLPLSDFIIDKLHISVAELLVEKHDADTFINNLPTPKL